MKTASKVLLVILALIVIAVAAVWLGMDYAAKRGVESRSTAVLGVRTDIGSVSIKPFSSTVGMRGLQVANPEGYKTDRMIALGSGSVRCDIPSLLSNEVLIHEIDLDSPELTVEVKGFPPKTNIGEVMDRLKANQPPPGQKQEQKRYKVELIRITNTKVRFSAGNGGDTKEAVLPNIELRDIKNADGTPVVLADIVSQIFMAMAESTVANAKGVIPDNALGDIGKSIDSAAEAFKKGDIRKGLEGLFKK